MNIPHNTIVVASVDPNIVYAGTDLGIWKSTTAGASWIHMGPETGMPNIAVFALKRNDKTGRLVAFTHGRGAFVLVSVTPVIAVSASSYDFGNVNVGSYLSKSLSVRVYAWLPPSTSTRLPARPSLIMTACSGDVPTSLS